MFGEFKDERPTGRTSWRDWLWVLVCAALSSIWILTAARQLSATYDETAYLKVGLERWRTGSMRTLVRMGTMPLPVDVCTLPLYLAERATGRRIDLEAEMSDWLPLARAGTLVFWWLLLIYAWRLGNLLGGPWAGRWAVGVLAVEPSFLGHAALATTDLASAACLLALAFHYRVARERQRQTRDTRHETRDKTVLVSWPSLIVPAVWFAAALLAKASAVVYGPIVILAAEANYRLSKSWREERFGLVSRVSCLVSVIPVFAVAGLGFILAGLYCGRWSRLVEVIAFQIRHNHDGHGGTFLLGRWSDAPLWYYFPTLLTIKLPLPLLVAPLGIALLRPRALVNWPIAAAAAMLLLSLTCHIQIGVRYLLPAMAFGAVGLAGAIDPQAGAPTALRGHVLTAHAHAKPWAWHPRIIVACSAAMALVVTAIQAWPNGLSYTNGLWAPADRGYLLLADSNYDWGQGLYELAKWQRRTAAGPIEVAYFGTDPTLSRLDMRPVNLPEVSLDEPGRRKLAVSTTLLYGEGFDRCEPVRRLKALTPSARTTTFLIYDLPATEAELAAKRRP